MLDEMLALANSVCLLALSRSGRHVLALLLCAGLIGPCCAEFAVDARRVRVRVVDPHPVRIAPGAHSANIVGSRNALQAGSSKQPQIPSTSNADAILRDRP